MLLKAITEEKTSQQANYDNHQAFKGHETFHIYKCAYFNPLQTPYCSIPVIQ